MVQVNRALGLVMLAACGAHSPKLPVEVLLDGPAANASGMGALVKSFDISPHQLVVLGDAQRMYLLGWGGAVPIEGLSADAFAYTHDGLLLAVRGTQLAYVADNGELAPLYDLPNPGMALAPGDGDTMYLFDRAATDGHYNLYRMSPGRRAIKVLDSPEAIDAVADDGARLYVAIGGVVFAAQPGKRMTVAARLAGDARIIAVATAHQRLYLSDGSSVYVLAGHKVERIAQVPAEVLRVHGGALFAFDSKSRMVVRVGGLP